MTRLSFTERVILSIFKSKNIIHGKTKLQKYVFLLMEFNWDTDYFNFVAHRFGPYSDNVNNALNILINNKLLEEKYTESDYGGYYSYEITQNGSKALKTDVQDDLIEKSAEIISKFGSMTYRQLIKYVYSNYPMMTTNSVIKDEI